MATVQLEFVGKSAVRRNMMPFLDRLRKDFSMLGEAGLHEMAKAELTKNAPRNKDYVQHLIGRDILGDGVEAGDVIPREDFMDVRIDDEGVVHERFLAAEYQAALDDYYRNWPQKIQAWPLMTITEKQRVLNTPVRDRERLIDPVGLSKTYVWRKSTNWIAEVEECDVEIIRNSEARAWFRSVDRYGLFVPQRAWDLPVVDRQAFSDAREAKRYERDMERKPLWTGL